MMSRFPVVTIALAFAFGSLVGTSWVFAKEDLPPVSLQRMKVPPKGGFDFIPGTRVTAPKISIFGKRVEAESVCAEGGVNDPKEIRIYKTGSKVAPFAAWCPGLLEGDSNTVTVFGKEISHAVRKVKPKNEEKKRIEWDQFQEAVQRLILKVIKAGPNGPDL